MSRGQGPQGPGEGHGPAARGSGGNKGKSGKRWAIALAVAVPALIAVAVVLVILLVAGGGGVPAGAEEAIEGFTAGGASSLRKAGSSRYAFGTATEYEGNWEGDRVSFEVDDASGEVVGFFRYGQPAGEPAVSEREAEKTALSFARQRFKGFEGGRMELLSSGSEGQGEGTGGFYSFTWAERDPESGVFLPVAVKVAVNAHTGKVDSYSAFRAEVVVSTRPSIKAEEAEALALEAVSMHIPEARVAGAPACVVTTLPVGEPGGEQALLWGVDVEGEAGTEGFIRRARVFVNAHTGEVEAVDPYM